MGELVEWPWAAPNPADDPGFGVTDAVAAVEDALAGLGESRVGGVAIGPWRQARAGAVALLGEGDERVMLRWAGGGDPPAWPAGAAVEAVGRWHVAGGRLVFDTADVVVLVDLSG
jgi:hypothetical protein